jgi:hypothetical protein
MDDPLNPWYVQLSSGVFPVGSMAEADVVAATVLSAATLPPVSGVDGEEAAERARLRRASAAIRQRRRREKVTRERLDVRAMQLEQSKEQRQAEWYKEEQVCAGGQCSCSGPCGPSGGSGEASEGASSGGAPGCAMGPAISALGTTGGVPASGASGRRVEGGSEGGEAASGRSGGRVWHTDVCPHCHNLFYRGSGPNSLLAHARGGKCVGDKHGDLGKCVFEEVFSTLEKAEEFIAEQQPCMTVLSRYPLRGEGAVVVTYGCVSNAKRECEAQGMLARRSAGLEAEMRRDFGGATFMSFQNSATSRKAEGGKHGRVGVRCPAHACIMSRGGMFVVESFDLHREGCAQFAEQHTRYTKDASATALYYLTLGLPEGVLHTVDEAYRLYVRDAALPRQPYVGVSQPSTASSSSSSSSPFSTSTSVPATAPSSSSSSSSGSASCFRKQNWAKFTSPPMHSSPPMESSKFKRHCKNVMRGQGEHKLWGELFPQLALLKLRDMDSKKFGENVAGVKCKWYYFLGSPFPLFIFPPLHTNLHIPPPLHPPPPRSCRHHLRSQDQGGGYSVPTSSRLPFSNNKS